ncbi:glycosyltransferase family 9 protein [Streptomyces ipomoeae]|uniref:glycosyltransferase family 9 protein n=1 Tax=Streptomyces ipomoeae TaxID=103232 RepID=UPI0011472A3E|nr:glycosyltransferase family 9 protein [Streptomyces ipomoeae]TQE19543.1 glycosyltransferase family 9 protein [Streptomyces ipomoeae]
MTAPPHRPRSPTQPTNRPEATTTTPPPPPADRPGQPTGGHRDHTTAPPPPAVLRALGLGDLLAGVPALRGIRRAFPGHHLVLALPSTLREAASATGAVDEILPAEAPNRGVPSLDRWSGPPPDIAIDLHGNGPESRDALAALSPGRLLAYAHPDPAPARPPVWRADEHERERWCGFLAAYGIAADPADLRLPPPDVPSPAPAAVVVHPGAESASRRWPAERFADLVRRLRTAGHRVVVSGGPKEDALVLAVAARAGLPEEDVLRGGLPFGELSALVARAALVVSGDTGLAHLAVAHATPSVTLFGPVSPRLWGPPRSARHIALWKPGPPGDPHGDTPDPQLLRVDVEEAATAALGLLRPASPNAPRWKGDDARVPSA